MPAPILVEDFSSIQTDERHMRHAKNLVGSMRSYSKEAADMCHFLGEFISLGCAPDMLSMRLFPNAKEISESFAAFDAVRYRLPQFTLGDPDVTVVAVGDGRTPRTAGTFALRSRWTCHSVDPILKGGTARWSAIKRLNIHPYKVEQFYLEAPRVIMVAVHSHAKLESAIKSVKTKELAVVAIPCCVQQILDREPDLVYQDSGIISPHRTLKIWNNVA